MRRSKFSAGEILIARSLWVIIAAFFFLIAGISCGAFTEVLMSPDQKLALTKYMSDTLRVADLAKSDYQVLFISSLKNNAFLILSMAILGVIPFAFPLIFIILGYKGLTIGFSSALLIENMAYKGTALALVSMVPQNILILPAIFLAGIISVNFSMYLRKDGFDGIKKNLSIGAGSYISFHFVLFVFLFLGSVVEAFVCPLLMKLVL